MNTSSRLKYDNDDDIGFGRRGEAIRSVYSKDTVDELKRIQAQIDRTENQSLKSTQRSLRLLNEAEDSGAKTAAQLVQQGEQLQGIDEKLTDIDFTLMQTQKNINKCQSTFYGFKNMFLSSTGTTASKSVRRQSDLKAESNVKDVKSPGVDVLITGSGREREINANLDEMSRGIMNLKSMAVDMEWELKRQDPMMERIAVRTERINGTIKAQDVEIKRIK